MKRIIVIGVRVIICAIEMALTLSVFFLLVVTTEEYTPNVLWLRLLSLAPITFATVCFELGLIRIVQGFVPCMRP